MLMGMFLNYMPLKGPARDNHNQA